MSIQILVQRNHGEDVAVGEIPRFGRQWDIYYASLYVVSKWSARGSKPEPWFNIKMSSCLFRNSHCGDKTVKRSSYLNNGNSYIFPVPILNQPPVRFIYICCWCKNIPIFVTTWQWRHMGVMMFQITGNSTVCVKTYLGWQEKKRQNSTALLSLCAGNSPDTGEFPAKRPVTRSFDVFFDLRLNKRLSKISWGWWFETPSHPLWRHCNGFSVQMSNNAKNRLSGMTSSLHRPNHICNN